MGNRIINGEKREGTNEEGGAEGAKSKGKNEQEGKSKKEKDYENMRAEET